jgi:hypothetical protein
MSLSLSLGLAILAKTASIGHPSEAGHEPHSAALQESRMSDRRVRISALTYARTAGVLYLINIACGLFGEIFVRAHLVAAGDPLTTAHRIMGSEFLFRCGIAGDLVMHITDIPMTVIFYVLLKPVSKDLSLLAALFGLLQTAILCANKLTLITVLLLLGGPSYLQAFDPNQRQALALLLLSLHEYGFGVGLVFFGMSCLVTGYLMFQSGYFPKLLGLLQAMSGVCYLINSFGQLLVPALTDKVFRVIVMPAFIGEFGTCLWLIVKGLNVAKWDERVRVGPVIEGPMS